jgi:polyphosphate kinase 2 (PPK2 family)
VLVERVRQLVPVSVWSARYDEINEWEAGLSARGVTMI